MKKIFLIAAIIAGTGYISTAQESKYAKNYKVCRVATGYAVCDAQNSQMQMPLAPAKDEVMEIHRAPMMHQVSPSLPPCNIPANDPIGVNRTDARQAPPVGVPNDGASKNNRRNLNYGNNAQLAPSNGRYTE